MLYSLLTTLCLLILTAPQVQLRACHDMTWMLGHGAKTHNDTSAGPRLCAPSRAGNPRIGRNPRQRRWLFRGAAAGVCLDGRSVACARRRFWTELCAPERPGDSRNQLNSRPGHSLWPRPAARELSESRSNPCAPKCCRWKPLYSPQLPGVDTRAWPGLCARTRIVGGFAADLCAIFREIGTVWPPGCAPAGIGPRMPRPPVFRMAGGTPAPPKPPEPRSLNPEPSSSGHFSGSRFWYSDRR
jgi:hypothetical protein